MKNEDKKLSDDFTKFLNQKLFYKDGEPLKQTKSKLKFFNECTTVIEEFINTKINPEPTSSLSPKISKSTNVNVMSIKVKNPMDGGKGTTIMTASESMKADDERHSGVKKNE